MSLPRSILFLPNHFFTLTIPIHEPCSPRKIMYCVSFAHGPLLSVVMFTRVSGVLHDLQVHTYLRRSASQLTHDICFMLLCSRHTDMSEVTTTTARCWRVTSSIRHPPLRLVSPFSRCSHAFLICVCYDPSRLSTPTFLHHRISLSCSSRICYLLLSDPTVNTPKNVF